MSAISHTSIFDTSFPLPEGFDPEGTEIVRCIDSELAFFKPKDNSVRTFLLSRRDGVTILFHATPDNLEAVNQLEPGCYNIIFVSPKLESPSHIIRSLKIRDYLTAMMLMWKSDSSPMIPPTVSASSSESQVKTFRGRVGVAFTKDGRTYDRITEGEPVGIVYHINGKCQKMVVGYKEIGQPLPDGMIETIRREHRDLCLDMTVCPVSAKFVPEKLIIAEPTGRASDGYYKIKSENYKGLIFQFDGPNIHILGRHVIGQEIPTNTYADLKSVYQNVTFDGDCLPNVRPSVIDWKYAKLSYDRPEWAFVAVPYGQRPGLYRFINSDLKDVIISRTETGFDVFGYNGEPKLTTEIFKTIYIRYRQAFGRVPHDTSFEPGPFSFRHLKDNLYIVTAGRFINLVFKIGDELRIAKGMGVEMTPLEREFAAELILSYSTHRIEIPLEVVKPREF